MKNDTNNFMVVGKTEGGLVDAGQYHEIDDAIHAANSFKDGDSEIIPPGGELVQ